MLQTIYMECPRGHHYKTGRFSPGLSLRIKSRCPVCRDYQVTYGVVTPFVSQFVPLRHPHHLTTVTSDLVRRQLVTLSDRPDVVRLLDRIPRETTFLSVREVLSSMEGWMRHKGRPGGALPEQHQIVEILGGTNDPQASIAFLRELRTGKRRQRRADAAAAFLDHPLEWLRVRAAALRSAALELAAWFRSEIQHVRSRMDR